MSNEHPITPSPELVREWARSCSPYDPPCDHIATLAARWGSDQELEACLQWFSEFYCMETWMQKDLEKFRAARRPEPKSQAEEALMALERTMILLMPVTGRKKVERLNIIRAALERLRELEKTVAD